MKKTEVLKILENNPNLQERMEGEGWSIRYRKDSDMLLMGTSYPSDSYYIYAGDTGVMIRVDANQKIYGFAIENAKIFMSKHPQVGFVFYPFVYPIRAFILYHVAKLFKNMNDLMRIKSLKTYIVSYA